MSVQARSGTRRWSRFARMCALLAALGVAAPGARAGSETPSHAREPAPTVAPATVSDACPSSPKGAAAILRGCSALEIALAPRLFFGSAAEGIADATKTLAVDARFGPAGALLDEAAALTGQAEHLLGRGKVCRGAGAASAAAMKLGDAEASIAGVVAAAQAAIEPIRGGHDVGEQELELATLSVLQALAERGIATAREGIAAAEAVCDAVAGKGVRKGRIVAIKDAAGWFRLGRKGALVGLPDRRFPPEVVPGRKVKVRLTRFEDGTALARKVNDPKVKGLIVKGPFKAIGPCMTMRIAPVQKLPAPNPKLHHVAGYRKGDGALHLEHLMRLGAKRSNTCPSAQQGKILRYAMHVQVQQGGQTHTVATELTEWDTPVPLPALTPDPAKVTAWVYRTACLQFANGMDVCDPPVQVGQPQKETIVVRPYGAYATAVYHTTNFSVIDDGDAGDFEPATVFGFLLSHVGSGTNPTFAAQGYRVVNGQSSKPVVQAVGQGQWFAVHEDDFYDPDYLFEDDQIQATGQQRPSALRWARIEGTRNGKPFWYAAGLPRLIRDRVASCPLSPGFTQGIGDPRPDGDPAIPSYGPTYPPMAPYAVSSVDDTFYELPFQAGLDPGTGLMNIDDDSDPARHPEWQAYAFDLGAAEGTPLLAARGGEVILLVESDPWNWNDPMMPEGWKGIGNYMWLLHEDDTIGVYFHMVVNSIVPEVGDRVSRGAQIAQVGNTGNSGGPHVHFEATGLDPFTQKERIRFRVGKPGNAIDDCYIPRSGEVFLSTNG